MDSSIRTPALWIMYLLGVAHLNNSTGGGQRTVPPNHQFGTCHFTNSGANSSSTGSFCLSFWTTKSLPRITRMVHLYWTERIEAVSKNGRLVRVGGNRILTTSANPHQRRTILLRLDHASLESAYNIVDLVTIWTRLTARRYPQNHRKQFRYLAAFPIQNQNEGRRYLRWRWTFLPSRTVNTLGQCVHKRGKHSTTAQTQTWRIKHPLLSCYSRFDMARKHHLFWRMSISPLNLLRSSVSSGITAQVLPRRVWIWQ
jgi:hypothetical protein